MVRACHADDIRAILTDLVTDVDFESASWLSEAQQLLQALDQWVASNASPLMSE